MTTHPSQPDERMIPPGRRLEPTMKTLEHKVLISSSDEILRLDILDWNRLNGYWDNTYEALKSVSSWLVGTSIYSIFKTAFLKAPERDDFPGWEHIGNHEAVGRVFWNWFYWRKRGTLLFSDSPDFSGTLIISEEQTVKFYGDIGKVSPSTFMHTWKQLEAGDLWISIPDVTTQIVIEPLISMPELWEEHMRSVFSPKMPS